jgi:AmiR/NasT family two-component response regulator
LDVKMPGMDGLRAAREITSSGRKVAVLILTAFSQRNLIEDAREAGVAAYLVKPFRQHELLPAIDGVLARCRQEWAIDEELETFGSTPDAAEDKLETRRLVEDAKTVLMDDHGMSESDAFAYIQRTAMSTRSRMRDVARRVVDGSLTP